MNETASIRELFFGTASLSSSKKAKKIGPIRVLRTPLPAKRGGANPKGRVDERGRARRPAGRVWLLDGPSLHPRPSCATVLVRLGRNAQSALRAKPFARAVDGRSFRRTRQVQEAARRHAAGARRPWALGRIPRPAWVRTGPRGGDASHARLRVAARPLAHRRACRGGRVRPMGSVATAGDASGPIAADAGSGRVSRVLGPRSIRLPIGGATSSGGPWAGRRPSHGDGRIGSTTVARRPPSRGAAWFGADGSGRVKAALDAERPTWRRRTGGSATASSGGLRRAISGRGGRCSS